MTKSLKKGHTETKKQQQNYLDLFWTYNVFCAADGNEINERNLLTTSYNEYLIFLNMNFEILLVT